MNEKISELMKFYNEDSKSYFYSVYDDLEIMYTNDLKWRCKLKAATKWGKFSVEALELNGINISTFPIEKFENELRNSLLTGACYHRMVLDNYEKFFGSDEINKSYQAMQAFGKELASVVSKTIVKSKMSLIEGGEE
jgi:hypothetical protein